MVRWLLFLLMVPVIFAAMKPVAGICELQGSAIVYVETDMGVCSTIPVNVTGDSYTTNLANLRLLSGSDCSGYWKSNDVLYVEVDGTEISRGVIDQGTGVQMLPPYIVSELQEQEVIEKNRPEPEVVFEPVELIEPPAEVIEEVNITIPSRAIENITETIKYTVSDLYYRTVETESDQDSVWRYLVFVIGILLLFIWWEVKS